MESDHSFLVESCGGNKVIKEGETYKMPQVLITFPKDEYQAVSLFRQKLIEHGARLIFRAWGEGLTVLVHFMLKIYHCSFSLSLKNVSISNLYFKMYKKDRAIETIKKFVELNS